jgi:hypothetical protein
LIASWAVKLPKLTRGWRQFLWGLLSNMTERQLSQLGYPELCPVTFSLPGGWLVVMRRAEPLSEEFLRDFDMLAFLMPPGRNLIPGEPKPDSFGRLDGRVVVVDYGEPS